MKKATGSQPSNTDKAAVSETTVNSKDLAGEKRNPARKSLFIKLCWVQIGFILSFEGAEPLVNDINLLDIFYKFGVRGLGLTHSQRNLAADGTPYYSGKANRLGGLSEFGIELVKRAGRLGMFMDVSHLNDPGFWASFLAISLIEFTEPSTSFFFHLTALWMICYFFSGFFSFYYQQVVSCYAVRVRYDPFKF